MKLPKIGFKSLLSILLACSMVTAFSLTTLASFDPVDPLEASADSTVVFREPTGTLTLARREVAVNQQSAKVGQTVLNGSLVRAGVDSHAIVDIPQLGQAEYGRLTETVLTMTPTSISSSMLKCGSITLTLQPKVSGLVKVVNIADVGVIGKHKDVDVRVMRGEVVVKYGQGQERIMRTGDHRDFDNATEVSSTGDAVFKVYCDEDHLPLPLFGLAGLAGIAIPIAAVGGVVPAGTPPFLSTLQP
jgi:hypothetical protein